MIADLEGDGFAEVVTYRAILDGESGSVRARLFEGRTYTNLVRDVAVGDVDLDGDQEIATGWKLYDADGSELWSIEPTTWDSAIGAMLIQADADDDAEIAWVSEYRVSVTDTDGSILSEVPFPSSPDYEAPMPCSLDADGDGLMDIVFATRATLYAMRHDGMEIWSLPIEDTSTFTTCSSFDFDADGVPEVLYNDEHTFYILDARTGAPLFQDPWESGTRADLPIVADLDGDGSVEIILGHPWPYDEYVPLRIYRHADRAWPPGSPFWGSETWSGTGIWPDGEVQTEPEAPWLKYGVWRGQPTSLVWGRDLSAEITDACVSACTEGAEVRLAVRIANLGPQSAPRGTPVAVYGLDDTGARVLLATAATGEDLDAGEATNPAIEVVLDYADTVNGVEIVAGDDGGGALTRYDCDESNNTVAWAPGECEE
ncbi:MAG: FG-GAP repeat domain-containing protein [Myxococcota bacterium]